MPPYSTQFPQGNFSVCKIIFSVLICLAFTSNVRSQQLVNTTGNSVSNGNVFIEYSIGEIAITTLSENANHVTQGLLQPILKEPAEPCKVLDYIPTAFTPNSDGLNDCFGLKQWAMVSNFEFSVWNRWGEMIFKTASLNACWDGKYRGTTQPIGTYVYMIKGTTACGPTFKKGIFTLIR